MRNNEQYINEFLELDVVSEKENTLRAYNIALRNFKERIGKDLDVVSTIDIKKYLKDMTQKYAQSTIDGAIVVIKMFYSYMEENQYMDINVAKTIKATKYKTKVVNNKEKIDYLTLEEVKMLINSIKQHKALPREKQVEFFRRRDIAILMLGFTEGLRQGEMANIKADSLKGLDINSKDFTLVIEDRKNGEDLVVNITSPSTLKALNEYKCIRSSVDIKDDSFFLTGNGRAMFNSDFNRMFKKRVELSPLDLNPELIHTHLTRHSCSMISQSQGLSVPQVAFKLGQKSVGTTLKHYTHRDMGAIRNNAIII